MKDIYEFEIYLVLPARAGVIPMHMSKKGIYNRPSRASGGDPIIELTAISPIASFPRERG